MRERFPLWVLAFLLALILVEVVGGALLLWHTAGVRARAQQQPQKHVELQQLGACWPPPEEVRPCYWPPASIGPRPPGGVF